MNENGSSVDVSTFILPQNGGIRKPEWCNNFPVNTNTVKYNENYIVWRTVFYNENAINDSQYYDSSG